MGAFLNTTDSDAYLLYKKPGSTVQTKDINMKKFVLAACMVSQLGLVACASKSDNISAAYVSPLQYQGYNCNQIRSELTRVSRRVNEVAGVQDHQASKDSVALGVGLVLFWPALFFMIGKDQKEELSRLKGEYEALEQAAIQKECDVAKEIDAAREMEAQRKEAIKQQEKQQGQANQ